MEIYNNDKLSTWTLKGITGSSLMMGGAMARGGTEYTHRILHPLYANPESHLSTHRPTQCGKKKHKRIPFRSLLQCQEQPGIK